MTPDGPPRANCQGMPLVSETGLWAAYFAEALGSEAIGICQYIRWRWRGSKLDELPPGVPPPPIQPKNGGLTDEEVAELLPGEDQTLIGNRIAALTTALGIPPCAGCGDRQAWLNRAHSYLRELLSPSPPAPG